MTIAAGFVCSDGIVLCADSQWTGQTKRYYDKVRWFKQGDNVVALVGAGMGLAINRMHHELEQRLKASMSARELLQMADDALWPLWSKHIKGDSEASLYLLMAIRTPDSLTLFENQGTKGFAPVPKKSQCVGAEGAVLGRYFADWLFDSSLPMARARKVATHLLKQAKEYDPDCGGDSHILMIPRANSEDPTEVAKGEIVDLEQRLDETKELVRKLIVHGLGIPGIDFNTATSDRRRAALEAAAREALNQVIMLEPVTLHMTGTVSSPLKMSRDETDALEGQDTDGPSTDTKPPEPEDDPEA